MTARLVGSLRQEMQLSLDEEAITMGIPYEATVPVTAQASSVKVAVYDYGADLLGSAMVMVGK